MARHAQDGWDGVAGVLTGQVTEESQLPPLAAVQARGDAERTSQDVHAAAAAGVRDGGGSLPHLGRIQAAFGAHDVTGVTSHVGGAAATACATIDAEAYATGDRVAFTRAPDLHTAAHEAAHVVQQRAGVQLGGGVGQAGDAYERHADEVAAAVVRGESAERLLSQLAGAPQVRSASPGAVQRFGAREHKNLGDEATHDHELAEIVLDDGSRLSFGDMVTLAGDLFGSVEEIRELARTEEGQREIRYARWSTLGALESELPRPEVDAATEQRVDDRYRRLAANNFSHFSKGGTAHSHYQDQHGAALDKAMIAGLTGQHALYDEAVTDEAFCQHYLSDMFSAGHVRTPRQDIKRIYERDQPGSIDRLVTYLAGRLYHHLSGPMPWYWQLANGAGIKNVEALLEQKIREQGGDALGSYSLGDLVSLAHHDRDNQGLHVVSDCGPDGQRVAGGYRWMAFGDGQLATERGELAEHEISRMTMAAMAESLREVEEAHISAQAAAPTDSCPDEDELTAMVTALHAAFHPYRALAYIPREAPQDDDRLFWEWGMMNDEMYEALEAALREEIIPQMEANAPRPAIMRFTWDGQEDPDGSVALDVGQAWAALCKELDISVLEVLFGDARPLGPEYDAGVPAPAGSPDVIEYDTDHPDAGALHATASE